MHRKGYRMLIAALLLLIEVLLAAMVYIGGLLLRKPPQAPVLPAPLWKGTSAASECGLPTVPLIPYQFRAGR